MENWPDVIKSFKRSMLNIVISRLKKIDMYDKAMLISDDLARESEEFMERTRQ